MLDLKVTSPTLEAHRISYYCSNYLDLRDLEEEWSAESHMAPLRSF
uniref:Uncharacterized protein n=1 Tax=Anguilla anguilla TaxID=7936 RepID=A0A0E9P7P5_ANGAN